MADFTIGQRKGLRIANSYPLYVLKKDYLTNQLIVGSKEELQRNDLVLKDFNWISQVAQADLQAIQVRVRYSSALIAADVQILEDSFVKIHLTTPSTEISPGQVGVLYTGDICLGGGIIV